MGEKKRKQKDEICSEGTSKPTGELYKNVQFLSVEEKETQAPTTPKTYQGEKGEKKKKLFQVKKQ